MNTLPIRHLDQDGDILVRDGLLLVFFSQTPLLEMAAGIGSAFEQWLKVVPGDALKWAMVGANAEVVSPMDSKTLSRCRALLDPKKAQKRELTFFSVEGPAEINPDFQFRVFARREIKLEGELQDTNVVEMRFPTGFLDEKGVPAFIEFSREMAQLIPYDSGYSSIALNWAAEGLLREAAAVIVPLALRHPGFDVHRNFFTCTILGRHVRGPGWLTFLSNELIGRLGGEDAVRGKLAPEVEVVPAGNGLLLCAGPAPAIGDVNRQENLPVLRSVARAIEPVTFFRDTLLESGIFRGDREKFQRWQRRFLD